MLRFGNHHRVQRGTTPIDFERFDGLKNQLKDNEFMVLNRFQPPPQHHYLRNALIGGAGLGAGLGALYHYREPLMKLGQRAINYATDKFHNLFPSNNTTHTPNPHNY